MNTPPTILLLKMLTISMQRQSNYKRLPQQVVGEELPCNDKRLPQQVVGEELPCNDKRLPQQVVGEELPCNDKRLPQQVVGEELPCNHKRLPSKLLGKNYLAKECKTDSENQFVLAVTKGKTIQVSHVARPFQVREWCRSGFKIKFHHLLAFFTTRWVDPLSSCWIQAVFITRHL